MGYGAVLLFTVELPSAPTTIVETGLNREWGSLNRQAARCRVNEMFENLLICGKLNFSIDNRVAFDSFEIAVGKAVSRRKLLFES